MKKAPDAFRTISEVAEILETPAHVLRFWESKFYQIRPVKRAGGRRYYRPDDVALINGIRGLLQEQGMTIRGVQRVLQEQGVRHVAALGGPLPLIDPDEVIDATEGDCVDLAAPGDAGMAGRPASPGAASSGTDQDGIRSTTILNAAADDRLEDAVEVAQDVAADPDPEDAPATDVEAATDPAIGVPADTGPDPVDEPEAVSPRAEDPAEDPMTQSDTLVPPTPSLAEPGLADPAPGSAASETPVVADRPKAPTATAARARIELDDDRGIDDAPEDGEIRSATERARIARSLRTMPRGRLGAKRDPLERLGRRIDTLLERMSEASGAGRW